MSTHDRPTNPHRRQFIATVGVAAGTVAFGTLVAKNAAAADLPPLKETDSLAVTMNYKEDTAKVDGKKFSNHKADQACANCQFYQGAATGNGPCQIFAGKSVSAKGWCQVWALKK
jgi:High potential iron-sulfur protein